MTNLCNLITLTITNESSLRFKLSFVIYMYVLNHKCIYSFTFRSFTIHGILSLYSLICLVDNKRNVIDCDIPLSYINYCRHLLFTLMSSSSGKKGFLIPYCNYAFRDMQLVNGVLLFTLFCHSIMCTCILPQGSLQWLPIIIFLI